MTYQKVVEDLKSGKQRYAYIKDGPTVIRIEYKTSDYKDKIIWKEAFLNCRSKWGLLRYTPIFELIHRVEGYRKSHFWTFDDPEMEI